MIYISFNSCNWGHENEERIDLNYQIKLEIDIEIIRTFGSLRNQNTNYQAYNQTHWI